MACGDAVATARKLSTNCASIMSDTPTINRLPNCANLPLTTTLACPASTELAAESPGSILAARPIDADEPPRSAPLPNNSSRMPASSSARTSMSPAKAAVAGPTLTLTLPL